MASLTHVCMWSENGWKQITAEQAAKLFPLSTVSAHSGLFMCELCGQYVGLTKEGELTRHFYHSSYEKSKDCPERTSKIVYSISYNAQEHDLPIRITGVSSTSFRFEIGLIRAPIRSFSSDFCVVIQPTGRIYAMYSKRNVCIMIRSHISLLGTSLFPLIRYPFKMEVIPYIVFGQKL